jgi:hypothetical protein
MRLFHRFFMRLVPLGVLAGVIAILVSSGGSIQSERIEAINFGSGPGSGYASGTFDGLLSAQKTAGVGEVFETLDWSQIETSQGTYNWTSPIPYAAVFASEKAEGLKIVAVLTGGPTYLAVADGGTVDSTQFLLRWGAFIQSAVDQFGADVDIWQIGTQINTSIGMSAYLMPSTPSTKISPDPKLYAQMLKVAAKIIKDADFNDQVWSGSLVSAASTSCAMNPLTFLLEVNGNGGWSSLDGVVYTPERGAAAPEKAITETSTACTSSLPTTNATLAGEVQSVQDLARQLGGKPLHIEGLGWSGTNLDALASNRSISADQVLGDELTRATVQLAGNNGLTDFSWQIDQANTPAAHTALSNLNSALSGARFVSEPQGQSGSVFEYRFNKGSQWIIIAWHAQDGDSPVPVTLSGLPVSSLTAYAVDAAGFTPGNGTAIPVDTNGNTTLLLNERPVVFLGGTSDLGTALQQDATNQTDVWKYDIKVAAHGMVNQLKGDMLHAAENLFDSAKKQAINWGQEELNKILN